MVKTFFKEIIIILLLCLAILLVLSVLFYDYNPISKVVPSKIAYTTPENIKEDLQDEATVEEMAIENIVYTIEGSDLNIYKKSKSYNPGKANPFAVITSNENKENSKPSTGTTDNNRTESLPTEENNNINKNIEEVPSNSQNTTFWGNTGNK